MKYDRVSTREIRSVKKKKHNRRPRETEGLPSGDSRHVGPSHFIAHRYTATTIGRGVRRVRVGASEPVGIFRGGKKYRLAPTTDNRPIYGVAVVSTVYGEL